MTYIPNRLNDYDTYTYNIRMYMVHPSYLSQLDMAIQNGNAKLIADNSQIAKYNISDLEQIFTVGHNLVREGIGNKFIMTMNEPNGATLINTLKQVSLDLGIENHLHARYIIAIDFRGRKSDGKPHKFNQTFYYPVIITSLNFNVSEGGAAYNINLIENSTLGYQYLSNNINEQITVVARTVGEFVTEFEKKYNNSIFNAWAINDSAGEYYDTFSFEFDDSTSDWKNWRFQILDDGLDIGAVELVGLPGEDPALQITVNNGTNITTLFSQVLQLTAEYKCIPLTGKSGLGQQFARPIPSENTNTTLDSLPTFFKMISNVEYGNYDRLKGDYQKKIVYKLKSYVVTNEIIDAIAYQASITNSGVQNRRVENLIANNFLRKRYDYYYTGKNTEVLEFDMQFDNLYYYITPYGEGTIGDPNFMAPVIASDKDQLMARLVNSRKEVASAKKAFNAASASKLNLSNDILDPRGESFITIGQAKIQFDNAFENFRRTTDEVIDILKTQYELTDADINYQLRFVADTISDQDISSSDNDRKGGTLKHGAVKANLENPADLVQIELGIRGDPYWLGAPNSFYNQQRNSDEIVDYEAGSPNFFLQVNLPTSDEDSAGLRKPQPDYQVSGVYTVKNVINRYRDGMFTQHLNAVRDLATNTITAFGSLASNNVDSFNTDDASIKSQYLDVAQQIENATRRITNNR